MCAVMWKWDGKSVGAHVRARHLTQEYGAASDLQQVELWWQGAHDASMAIVGPGAECLSQRGLIVRRARLAF